MYLNLDGFNPTHLRVKDSLECEVRDSRNWQSSIADGLACVASVGCAVVGQSRTRVSCRS